jgi:hypothetical protein
MMSRYNEKILKPVFKYRELSKGAYLIIEIPRVLIGIPKSE